MLFYEIIAIAIGCFIIIGGIVNLTKNYFNLKAAISMLVIGAFYLGLGIAGFFVPENYEWVYTTILIVLSVISMIVIKLVSKKN